ncbi:hypothetical protein RUND412_004697 [Rhizina undulata]
MACQSCACSGKKKQNRVILGCMNFGPDPQQGARVTNVDNARKILEYLKSEGYDELDTARIYVAGKSESFLAEAGYKDLDFKVATKVYPTQPGIHEPTVLKAKFRESLEALGAEKVHIFYLHAADRSVPFEDTLRAVNELYQEGKFDIFGVSNYASYELAELVVTCRERGWVVPKIYEAMYNPFTRAIEKELVPACRKYGLDIVAYNPLAGGLLTGKYSRVDLEAPPIAGRFSNTFQDQGSLYRARYMAPDHFAALERVKAVAEKFSLTVHEIAIRWLIHHSALKTAEKGGNDGIIIGVSELGQMKEGVEASRKGPLPEEVVKVVDGGWEVTEGVTTT